MTDLLSTIGPKLKRLRLKRSLTQKQLSEALHMDTMHYSRIERGERPITLQKIIEICDFFNISLDDLITMQKSGEADIAYKKEKYEAICEKLSKYSGGQLVVIESMIDALSPYI